MYTLKLGQFIYKDASTPIFENQDYEKYIKINITKQSDSFALFYWI